LVGRDSATRALRAVHDTFELDQAPPETQLAVAPSEPLPSEPLRKQDAADVVSRLRGVDMEELTIDDVSIDQSQARVTIRGVPDSPGVAAKVFEEVAQAGIFIDMIVQSYNGRADQATLSFTVPQNKLHQSLEVTDRLAATFHCESVTHSPRIAKLSVSGVGLRSHTGVAIRMFRALAAARINVEMINTSEVRVNVVVDGEHGETAMARLQEAFADVLR